VSNPVRFITPPDDLFDPTPAPRPKTLAAEELSDWVGRRKPKGSSGIAKSRWDRIRTEASRMMASGDWSDATASHLVALYASCHMRVYGIEATELEASAKERLAAAGVAARLLRAQFDDDAGEMADFIRWVWIRENGREKKRRAEGTSGGRIGWRLQFNGTLLTEWRLDKMRRGGQ